MVQNSKYLSLNWVMAFLTLTMIILSFSTSSKVILQEVTTGTIEANGDTKLSDEQIKNANAIINTGKGMGMSDRDIIIALMTAIQESTLINDGRSDDWFWLKYFGKPSESEGLFQQINKWGSLECRMSPTCSAKLFYEALKKVPNRDSKSLNDVAAEVQRPAEEYRGHYAQHEELAISLLAKWKPNDSGFSIDAASSKPEIKEDVKNTD